MDVKANLDTSIKINTDPLSNDEFAEIQEFTKCIFCEPPRKKILAETDNFYVTYDACALLDGHIELHSKEHIGCSAEVDSEMYDEFIDLKKWMGELVKETYGQVSFYEHGRAGHCSMTVDGVICHHFHMHALPLSEDVSPQVTSLVKPIMIQSEREIPELYEQYDQYLYLENTLGQKFFYPVNQPIPSHYLRTVIAEAINHPERADWENYFDKDAINRFKQLLAKEKSKDND